MQTTDLLCPPEELGISQAKLDDLMTRVRHEVDDGLLPAVQVALAKDGKLALFESYGNATNDSLFAIFSATKAITSAAAWLLIQDGKLDISSKVIDLVPEFAANDKGEITVEQLFTHTAGFPHAPFRVTDWADKEKRYKRFSDWRTTWAPGTRYEYHPTSSMWVIAEIIERVSGEDFQAFVRQHISDALGLPDLYVGAPDEVHDRIVEITLEGEPLTAEDYEKMGLPAPPVTEVTPDTILNFNTDVARRTPVAGGGGIMSAAELALFYQALLGQCASGASPWNEETMAMAREVRTGDLMDMTVGTTTNRGLGICIAGDGKRNLRGFGHTNSEHAFGHAGAGGQIAWADPATGISFAYCTSGHDQNPIRQGRRSISISNKAAVCAD